MCWFQLQSCSMHVYFCLGFCLPFKFLSGKTINEVLWYIVLGFLFFYNAFWHLSAEYFYNAFDFKNKLFSPRDLQIMQEATIIYINQFFFLRGFTPELAPFKGFSLTFCVFLMYLFCTGPIIRSGQYSICFIVWGKKTFVKYMDADGLMKILILFLV